VKCQQSDLVTRSAKRNFYIPGNVNNYSQVDAAFRPILTAGFSIFSKDFE